MGKGCGTSIMPVTAGCRRDIELLFEKYKSLNTLDYKPFATCFKEMNFATIFMGRVSPAELYEFSERILQMAISYAMVYRKRNLPVYLSKTKEQQESQVERSSVAEENIGNELTMQERIFGIYLAYSLYYVQPNTYVAQIRVTPDQLADLQKLLADTLLPERHLDSVYALYRLIDEGAFRVVAFENEYNPLLHKRYDNSADEGLERPFEIQGTGLLEALGGDEIFRRADILHERYVAAKQKLGFPSDANALRESVGELYADVMNSFKQEEEKTSYVVTKASGDSTKKTGITRHEIKAKAYKAKAISAKHRRRQANGADSSTEAKTEENADKSTVSEVMSEVTGSNEPTNSGGEDAETSNKDDGEAQRQAKQSEKEQKVDKRKKQYKVEQFTARKEAEARECGLSPEDVIRSSPLSKPKREKAKKAESENAKSNASEASSGAKDRKTRRSGSKPEVNEEYLIEQVERKADEIYERLKRLDP